MLQATLIGHLGGDADVKTQDGREFVTIRVAHSERWTDQNDQLHENTIWVDCIIDGHPKVVEFLKRGTIVCVTGSAMTRLYSSAKDRCMKAGLQIRVRSIELIGAKPDAVPSRLYSTEDGHEFVIKKYYQCPELVRGKKDVEWYPLKSRSGETYVVDRNGWCLKYEEQTDADHSSNESQA